MADNEETIQGVARNVEWRPMGEAYSQLTFNIKVTDEVGDEKEKVTVVMVGVLKGSLSDGDEVKVEGVRGKDGIIKPNHVDNVTKGSKIEKWSVPDLIKASGGGSGSWDSLSPLWSW